MLELIKREPSEADSASAASNADSGRGTSESGDQLHRSSTDNTHVQQAEVGTLDRYKSKTDPPPPPLKPRQTVASSHHAGANVTSAPTPVKKDLRSTGCHGNISAPCRTSSFTGAPRTPACKVHPPPPPSYHHATNKPTLHDYYPARTIGNTSLPQHIQQAPRCYPSRPHAAVSSLLLEQQSEMSADNASDGGSSTSGSYIVDMAEHCINGTSLKAIDV